MKEQHLKEELVKSSFIIGKKNRQLKHHLLQGNQGRSLESVVFVSR